jgi:hypothetical protein
MPARAISLLAWSDRHRGSRQPEAAETVTDCVWPSLLGCCRATCHIGFVDPFGMVWGREAGRERESRAGERLRRCDWIVSMSLSGPVRLGT